ncbi:acyltransferase family protein [Bradyrhizobium cytisi]|nr:acyltransferase [Bradyrhizobium cytisi]
MLNSSSETASKQNKAADFRPDIEGLRAIAVLSVIGFHYGVPWLTGGFVGVDIFFVISGYLISQLLLRELNGTGTIDFVAFYGRRARRLLPAALLVTVATLIVSYFVLSPLEQKEIAKSAAASSVFATNMSLLSQALNYFGPESSLNPFLHTWSLSVEEQFYFLWPALLLVLWRTKGRILQFGLVFITLLSFVLCIYLTYTKQAWAFYLSPARAWEFGLGALASLFPFPKWATYTRSAAVSGWIALVGLIFSCFLLDEFSAFPGYCAAAPVAATAARQERRRSVSIAETAGVSVRRHPILRNVSLALAHSSAWLSDVRHNGGNNSRLFHPDGDVLSRELRLA